MPPADSLRDRFIRIRLGLTLKDRDPLAFWHFAVARLREAFALLTADARPISELHAIGPNKGGKTYTDAAFVVACCQKRTHLDGVPLPQWRGPVEAAQVVLDYPQQLLSVQPAYLRALGQWPHHPRYQGATLKSLHIMPVNGDPRDETKWSVIHFLSAESRRTRGSRGLGVRADIVAFDEPPPIEILRELRKAAHAGRRLIILLGFTPTVRSQWGPILEDLGREIGSPAGRDRIHRVDRRRAVVRWNLDEVDDRVLSAEEKNDLKLSYLGPAMDWEHPLDPLARARWYGDTIDTTGLCPFHLPTLVAMLEDCVPPLRDADMGDLAYSVERWKVSQEANADTGQAKIVRTIPIETWALPQINRGYVVTIDPSSGVDDNLHDPYELHVTERGSGDLVLRAGGYLPGYIVGCLAAGIARQYNNAPIDVEVNDRWGVNVVEGVQASRYGNFARERRELKDGSFVKEIGFHNTAQSRPKIIGAIQNWIEAYRAGIRYGRCPSKAVIETLMDCILDENGKIVGAPGVHDEALIVRGQALRRCVKRHGMEIPEAHPPVQTREEKIVAMIQGRMPKAEALRRPGQDAPRRGGMLRATRPSV